MTKDMKKLRSSLVNVLTVCYGSGKCGQQCTVNGVTTNGGKWRHTKQNISVNILTCKYTYMYIQTPTHSFTHISGNSVVIICNPYWLCFWVGKSCEKHVTKESQKQSQRKPVALLVPLSAGWHQRDTVWSQGGFEEISPGHQSPQRLLQAIHCNKRE